MRRRSSVKGVASFKRLLKRLPDSANKRVIALLYTAGPPAANTMRSLVPVLATPRPDRTPGAARNSISWKVTPKSLNLKVGQLTRRDFVFYAHILDVGRGSKDVRIKRGPRAGHAMHIRALRPLYIVRQTKAQFRIETLPAYRTLLTSILTDAANGAGDD